MSLSPGPLRVHGSEISYFTGKLEAGLRYKGIPYERVPARPDQLGRIMGSAQIPAIELSDGRWLTDTTPILSWLEAEVPEPPIVPGDPVVAWVSRLLEDYGDEWLWRPAMHYRWSYVGDAALLSRKIVDELTDDVPLPRFLKRFMTRTRQRNWFVKRDGVDANTWDHVEATYRGTLERMRAVLADRPFLLGAAPSLADFGFFASMFRHFGMDPTPSTIMRETAPEVYAWVARVWNARAEPTGGFEPKVPEAVGPLLDEVGATHLEHLAANAQAFAEGRKHFDVEVQGVGYRNLRTAPYRVACVEALRAHYEATPEPARAELRALLERHGCLEPLFRVDAPPSGLDLADPFAKSLSMTGYRGL